MAGVAGEILGALGVSVLIEGLDCVFMALLTVPLSGICDHFGTYWRGGLLGA